MNEHYSQRKPTSTMKEIRHASMQTMQTVKAMQTQACKREDRICTHPKAHRKKTTVRHMLQRTKGRAHRNGAFSSTNLKAFIIITT